MCISKTIKKKLSLKTWTIFYIIYTIVENKKIKQKSKTNKFLTKSINFKSEVYKSLFS